MFEHIPTSLQSTLVNRFGYMSNQALCLKTTAFE